MISNIKRKFCKLIIEFIYKVFLIYFQKILNKKRIVEENVLKNLLNPKSSSTFCHIISNRTQSNYKLLPLMKHWRLHKQCGGGGYVLMEIFFESLLEM